MENPYIYVVVALGAVALASFAIYDSERLRESRTALGIILLASLILPISSVVSGISELDFGYKLEYDGEKIVEGRLEEAFCLGIAEAVREEFSIKKDNISCTADRSWVRCSSSQKVGSISKERISGETAVSSAN